MVGRIPVGIQQVANCDEGRTGLPNRQEKSLGNAIQPGTCQACNVASVVLNSYPNLICSTFVRRRQSKFGPGGLRPDRDTANPN